MKIAIATFGERVSPRFDCAPSFLIVSIEDGRCSSRQELAAYGWAPHERINHLVALGVKAVVCGGIDRWSVESLRSAGIKIHSRIAGTISDAVSSLTRGELASEEENRDDVVRPRRVEIPRGD